MREEKSLRWPRASSLNEYLDCDIFMVVLGNSEESEYVMPIW